MQSNLEKYKKDLNRLIHEGELLYYALIFDHLPKEKEKFKKKHKEKFKEIQNQIPLFSEKYQTWYSEALECIRQLLPSRLDDFISYYKPTVKRKKDDITYENYTISDCLNGLYITRTSGLQKEKVVGPEAAIPKFRQQLKIVESLKQRFESSLFDIKQLVQADLFDSELEAARELNKKGFTRGAGAIAGVVLEKHLAQVCKNHNIPVKKKNPTINDFNQLLKNNDVIEVSTWRFIQHLADLRNLCDHNKNREPTREEIEELINGVEKITKTIF